MSDQRGAQSLHENLSRILYGKHSTSCLRLPRCFVAAICCSTTFRASQDDAGRVRLRDPWGSFAGLQITPDLLPSTSRPFGLRPLRARVNIMPGPVFTNISARRRNHLRAAADAEQSPGCMGERAGDIDGVARARPAVFIVIATQNPIEFHGTYRFRKPSSIASSCAPAR